MNRAGQKESSEQPPKVRRTKNGKNLTPKARAGKERPKQAKTDERLQSNDELARYLGFSHGAEKVTAVHGEGQSREVLDRSGKSTLAVRMANC